MMKNNEKTSVQTAVRDRRRAKYGSLSVAFTVVFLALILALNLVLSSLSLSGDLTVDLTQEDFTSIGDESRTLIENMGDNVSVTIYFLAERDKFSESANNYKGVNLTAMIRDLAETYEREFAGRIKVEYKPIGSDPEFEQKYTEEAASTLSSTSVIVQGKYHYRVLSMPAFFETDSDGNYYSFNGEYRLTSAILQSSISEPQVVTLTAGHGETPSSTLTTLLEGAGFEVKTSNIAQDGIDSRTEIIICADPVTDFTESEIDSISVYLSKYNGFIVMVDSETPKLTNLLSCLEDYWGIGYNSMHRVTDSEHSLSKETNINAKYVTVDSDSSSSSAAYQIHKTVSDMGGVISTVMPDCVELYIRPENTKDGFVVETVLTTYETAVVTYEGASASPAETPIMLLSTKGSYDSSNVYQYSYVMLSASTGFASDANLGNGTYGNKRMLLSAVRAFSANRVAPDIKSKTFGDTALDIELGTANTLTVLICTIVPGAVLILGIVMFLRRRHL